MSMCRLRRRRHEEARNATTTRGRYPANDMHACSARGIRLALQENDSLPSIATQRAVLELSVSSELESPRRDTRVTRRCRD